MSQVMNQGQEQSLLAEQMGALIDQSVNIEKAVADSRKLIQDQGVSITGLDDRVGRMEAMNTQIASAVKSLDANINKIAGQRTLSPEGAGALQKALVQHASLFDKPLKKSVRHTHFLGWHWWFLGSMLLLVGFLGYALNKTSNIATKYEENDIKWRSLMLSKVPVLLTGVLAADSLYHADPNQFRSDVEFEEQRRARYNAKLWLKAQTENEIKDLEKQEKKR
ncbi:MAG: hypothetical protein Q8943_15435 [Bacteroidota bacterium]|nr:hypothetical protein [Bacteroidota bacterium]